MKNKKLFDKTIGILVNAYMKGTLNHEKPCACGIGNIIAANNGYILQDNQWYTAEGLHIRQEWYSDVVHGGDENDQMLSSNYSLSQLKTLEAAFEDRNKKGMIRRGDDDDPTGYLGLMDMVDALIDIHQGTEDQKVEAKEMIKIEL